MARLTNILATTVTVGSVVVCAGQASAQPGQTRHLPQASTTLASLALDGRLEGVVVDERGAPLSGVAVTAQGVRLLFAVTDRQGRFRFERVQPGPYLVGANLPGYVASARELLQVMPSSATWQRFTLSSTSTAAVLSRPPSVMTAGLGSLDDLDSGTGASSEIPPHDHSPIAWRLRHLKRSVLRETTRGLDLGEFPSLGADDPPAAVRAGAMPSSVSVLPDGQVSGQVSFLTSSAFDGPAELFSTARMPSSIAYVALGAPLGDDSSWSVQGALMEGDLSSWVLVGFYERQLSSRHALTSGVSYGRQRYDGPDPIALAAMGDDSRTVTSYHAYDRWTLSPTATLTFGSRYASYGYIEQPLISPSAVLRWAQGEQTWLRASVSQLMLAPGAEEFEPTAMAGFWLPPQRTFSPLRNEQFQAERTRHVQAAIDHQVASYVFTARTFWQQVDDQIVTLFGVHFPDRPRANLGHYRTANAGDVEAYGWAVGLRRPVASRVRGSVEYTMARAHWTPSAQATTVARWAPSAARPTSERIHDVTTIVETEIPETATRVYALYKLNTGYTRPDTATRDPRFDARFDVQVSQRLPFMSFSSAEWEVLVAVRNLFREQAEGSSIYDELMVVRPPKRLVGGVLVRF